MLHLHNLGYSKIVLIRLPQAKYFRKEIESLKMGEPVQRDSSILSLNPLLDNDGVLHVQGCLNNAEILFEQRHPILLHRSHKLTKLTVMRHHLANLHAGPCLLKSIIRRTHWIRQINWCIKPRLKTCTVYMHKISG